MNVFGNIQRSAVQCGNVEGKCAICQVTGLPAKCQRGVPCLHTTSRAVPQRQLRYIEWKGVKIYDFQKITFSTLFKLHIAGLGVLIPKRYHMLG